MTEIVVNPMYSKNNEDLKPNYSKFLVTYVVKNIDEEDITAFITYCKTNKLKFIYREYSSSVYGEDKEYVEKLPAYHIYFDNLYVETCYENPIYIMNSILNKKEQTPTIVKNWFRVLLARFYKN